MNCDHLWMMTGTAKMRKYIPIGKVYHKLPPNSAEALLPFHCLTGCDTTSYFCGHTKRSAWKTFLHHHHLIREVGVGNLTPTKLKSAETFVCEIYGADSVESVEKVHRMMFEKSCKPESLPPTSDALKLHIQRVPLPEHDMEESRLSRSTSSRCYQETRNCRIVTYSDDTRTNSQAMY